MRDLDPRTRDPVLPKRPRPWCFITAVANPDRDRVAGTPEPQVASLVTVRTEPSEDKWLVTAEADRFLQRDETQTELVLRHPPVCYPRVKAYHAQPSKFSKKQGQGLRDDRGSRAGRSLPKDLPT